MKRRTSDPRYDQGFPQTASRLTLEIVGTHRQSTSTGHSVSQRSSIHHALQRWKHVSTEQFISLGSVIVLSSSAKLLSLNIMNQAASTTYLFSQSSGGSKFQVSANIVRFWGEPHPRLQMVTSSMCAHMAFPWCVHTYREKALNVSSSFYNHSDLIMGPHPHNLIET